MAPPGFYFQLFFADFFYAYFVQVKVVIFIFNQVGTNFINR